MIDADDDDDNDGDDLDDWWLMIDDWIWLMIND